MTKPKRRFGRFHLWVGTLVDPRNGGRLDLCGMTKSRLKKPIQRQRQKPPVGKGLGAQTWLMKSEPDVYSAAQWQRDGATWWEGVRNYQARNFMTQSMRVGDTVLFYHSSCEEPGIYALGRVSQLAKPDPTQFNPQSLYFDESSTRDNPRWSCVQVEFKKLLRRPILLAEIRAISELKNMVLLKASRLSIQPVTQEESRVLLNMGESLKNRSMN